MERNTFATSVFVQTDPERAFEYFRGLFGGPERRPA